MVLVLGKIWHQLIVIECTAKAEEVGKMSIDWLNAGGKRYVCCVTMGQKENMFSKM